MKIIQNSLDALTDYLILYILNSCNCNNFFAIVCPIERIISEYLLYVLFSFKPHFD